LSVQYRITLAKIKGHVASPDAPDAKAEGKTYYPLPAIDCTIAEIITTGHTDYYLAVWQDIGSSSACSIGCSSKQQQCSDC